MSSTLILILSFISRNNLTEDLMNNFFSNTFDEKQKKFNLNI